MAIVFGDVAPTCPISRDQPAGVPSTSIRTTIPRAFDLPSAIAAVNITRSIISQAVFAKVINNVYAPPKGFPGAVIDKERNSRWKEVTSQRVKRKYKYYAKDADGKKDDDVWVMTERIERMVWTDSAWKTSLTFVYGDKGDDAEPVGGSGGGGGSEGE